MLRNPLAPVFVVAVLAAAGCSSDKAASGGGGSGAAPAARPAPGDRTRGAPPARAPGPGAHQIQAPPVPRPPPPSAPTGMKVEHSETYVSWTIPVSFELPSLSVVVGLPLREGQIGSATPMGQDAAERVIARNEVLADGGYIHLDHRTDGRFFKLSVCRPTADASLCCSVIQRVTTKSPPIADLPAVEAWAERICTSMKAS